MRSGDLLSNFFQSSNNIVTCSWWYLVQNSAKNPIALKFTCYKRTNRRTDVLRDGHTLLTDTDIQRRTLLCEKASKNPKPRVQPAKIGSCLLVSPGRLRYRFSHPVVAALWGKNRSLWDTKVFTFSWAERSQQICERCEWTSKKMSEWPSTFVPILGCSEPTCAGGWGLSIFIVLSYFLEEADGNKQGLCKKPNKGNWERRSWF